ncbi:hypothetical protein BJ742DRAFT_788594 [Cladochytrium replicatum]|nr:hypothetical protein BJ742DRAFT_788594 [Cladochytrium replicatum]
MDDDSPPSYDAATSNASSDSGPSELHTSTPTLSPVQLQQVLLEKATRTHSDDNTDEPQRLDHFGWPPRPPQPVHKHSATNPEPPHLPLNFQPTVLRSQRSFPIGGGPSTIRPFFYSPENISPAPYDHHGETSPLLRGGVERNSTAPFAPTTSARTPGYGSMGRTSSSGGVVSTHQIIDGSIPHRPWASLVKSGLLHFPHLRIFAIVVLALLISRILYTSSHADNGGSCDLLDPYRMRKVCFEFDYTKKDRLQLAFHQLDDFEGYSLRSNVILKVARDANTSVATICSQIDSGHVRGFVMKVAPSRQDTLMLRLVRSKAAPRRRGCVKVMTTVTLPLREAQPRSLSNFVISNNGGSIEVEDTLMGLWRSAGVVTVLFENSGPGRIVLVGLLSEYVQLVSTDGDIFAHDVHAQRYGKETEFLATAELGEISLGMVTEFDRIALKVAGDGAINLKNVTKSHSPSSASSEMIVVVENGGLSVVFVEGYSKSVWTTVSGYVLAEYVEADDRTSSLSIVTTSGSVRMHDIRVTNLSIRSSTGSILVGELTVMETLNVRSDQGSQFIGTYDIPVILNGGNDAKTYMDIRNTMGQIRFYVAHTYQGIFQVTSDDAVCRVQGPDIHFLEYERKAKIGYKGDIPGVDAPMIVMRTVEGTADLFFV